jgi:hypothetical protein
VTDAEISLFDYPNAPGFKARSTSEATAKAAAPMAMGLRARVFEAIKQRPDTPEGVARRLKVDILNIRPRLSELSAKGRIEDSGRRGPSRGGKEAIIWRVVRS